MSTFRLRRQTGNVGGRHFNNGPHTRRIGGRTINGKDKLLITCLYTRRSMGHKLIRTCFRNFVVCNNSLVLFKDTISIPVGPTINERITIWSCPVYHSVLVMTIINFVTAVELYG